MTAIEYIPEIAAIYKEFFPQDEVIVTDAHQYLLDHFDEYDFIWASPPCPTHSRMCLMSLIPERGEGRKIKYPDMTLYEEIILLKTFYKGNWIIENVISYYEPLIKPYNSGNHYFWSNKIITDLKQPARNIIRLTKQQTIVAKETEFNIQLDKFNLTNDFKQKILNNCVTPELGLHCFNCVYSKKQSQLEL